MDDKKVTKFFRDFQRYRKLQAKLVKIRNKAPDPRNVQPAKDLMTKIQYLLDDMDKAAAAHLTPVEAVKA